MARVGARLAVACLLVGGFGARLHGQERHWSPSRKYYAVSQPGRTVGQGEEQERFVIYTGRGKRVSIAHIWTKEPTGARRVGIRGCERWGWIDDARLFCEGSINPSTGVYLVFDAATGRELREHIGSHFVWSPRHSRVASFGNVPHFTPEENKSDSLEIDGRVVYPGKDDRERHWFRSQPVWSADGRQVAVVDHRQSDSSLWLIIVSIDGRVAAELLARGVPRTEWPPKRDRSLRWGRQRFVVE